MLEKALVPSLKKLSVPERCDSSVRADGLVITRLISPAKTVPAKFEPYRSRGRTCRRLRAVTEEGLVLIIEFATFKEDYGREVAGVIRARQPVVDGEILNLDRGSFRDPPLTLTAFAPMRDDARNCWTSGIAYVTEQTNRAS